MNDTPGISVVICTRDRGRSAALAVQSVLASHHPSFELILIDQSDDWQTREALAPFFADPRFRYVCSSTKGLGAARNAGLRLACAGLVAFTDDDCSVPPNWLEVIESTFARHPQVLIIFSTVEPGPHDAAAGFVPAYTCRHNKAVRTLWDKSRSRCIGASMAVRRIGVLEMGGFDEMLGAGALFSSAEDADIAIRALTKGHWVYEIDDVAVTHYGFRTWHEGKALARRDWIGLGACYIKSLRAGHWGVLSLILYEILFSCFLEPMKPVLKLRRPRGLGRLSAFLSGFVRGMLYPLDHKHVTYIQPDERPATVIL